MHISTNDNVLSIKHAIEHANNIEIKWLNGLCDHKKFLYPNAYAKVKKCIFSFRFTENCFAFGIILNDFWSSTISAIQIRVSFIESKNPGIQPAYHIGHIIWRYSPKVFSGEILVGGRIVTEFNENYKITYLYWTDVMTLN